MVSLVVLLAFYAIVNGALQWTTLFLPLVVLPLVFGTMGFAWFLASLGVYLRDVGQITGIITTVLMFLSPIFYPLSNIPPPYRSWIYINPLTFVIEQARAVLIWGRLPDWVGWGIYFGVSLAIAWGGFWWFQKTRRGFADVL